MHIESLKVFCDLADSESFTKTAQINGVTQSAISQQIQSWILICHGHANLGSCRCQFTLGTQQIGAAQQQV